MSSSSPPTAKTPKPPTFLQIPPTPPATSPIRDANYNGATVASSPPRAASSNEDPTPASLKRYQELSSLGPPVAWWPTKVATVSPERRRSVIASLAKPEPSNSLPVPGAPTAPSSLTEHHDSPHGLASLTLPPGYTAATASTQTSSPYATRFANTAHVNPGAIFQDLREKGKVVKSKSTTPSELDIYGGPLKPIMQSLEPWQRGLVRMMGGYAPEPAVQTPSGEANGEVVVATEKKVVEGDSEGGKETRRIKKREKTELRISRRVAEKRGVLSPGPKKDGDGQGEDDAKRAGRSKRVGEMR